MQGFDEYMNLVLDEAEEVSLKRKSRKPLGTSCSICSLLCVCACHLFACQEKDTMSKLRAVSMQGEFF